jgi:hypothetical protein
MKTFYNTILRQAEGAAEAAPAETPIAPPPAEEAAAPVSAGVDGDGEALGKASPSPSDSESRPPQGLLDRIGQLTRQKRELEERLQAMEAPQQQYYEAPQGAGGVDPKQIQMEIYRQAQELAKQNEWKNTTEKIWNEGLSKYGDWAPQLNNMAQILGGIPISLTEAAIESGAPHEVLYHLAKNVDEAARIALLPPTRQAVAVAKLAQNVSAPRKVTSAPPPISPKVQGIGSAPASLDDPNISMEEWARLRNEQAANRRRR